MCMSVAGGVILPIYVYFIIFFFPLCGLICLFVQSVCDCVGLFNYSFQMNYFNVCFVS